jgi:divalent metal cation (Fe/Co/Zn/Cd) transporter
MPFPDGKPNGVAHWEFVEQRRKLEIFIAGYKSLEGSVSILAGFLARSAALTGFGIASLIQMFSAMAFLWGLRRHLSEPQREWVRKLAARAVGVCLVALGLSIAYASVLMLVRRQAPGKNIPGIIIPFISLDVLTLVTKRRLDIRDADMDSTDDNTLAYLPTILLAGLLLNIVFRLWWADPGAALVMAPIILRQGFLALKERVIRERPILPGARDDERRGR